MMRIGKGSGGFSLIEILVATTILLVIVILASLVFQQTTGAYDTGERKVSANVSLRNIVGSITRDLAIAVDADEYDGVPQNSWGGSSIRFAALTGRAGYDATGRENTDCRTLQYITYTAANSVVRRTAQSYKYSNGTWSKCGEESESYVYKGTSADNDDIGVAFSPSDSDSLPERLYIHATLKTTGQTAAVGVGSGGRRGWGSPDEIWVGLKGR